MVQYRLVEVSTAQKDNMAKRMTLKAKPRTVVGRKVKNLRRDNVIPAHIFGQGVESISIQLDLKEFKILYSQAGETALVDLQVEGESAVRPVLIRGVDVDPVSSALLHVDFHQVNLREKVTAQIPVETIGESEAVKNGGVLVLAYSEIEVEALPTDLPEHFMIDVSKLVTMEDVITVADLEFDREKVSISLEADEVIANIQEQAAEEEPVVAAEPVEVELVKQGATKEEEVPEAVSKE